MKNLFISLFIAIPFCVNAQIKIKNMSLDNPNLKELYKYINNVIRVTGLQEKADIKLVSSTMGEFKPLNTDSSFYDFNFVIKKNKFDTLRIYEGSKILLTKVYEVKEIKDPIARLGNISDTVASINEILNNPRLLVVFPNCNYKFKKQVTSFAFYIYRSNTLLYPDTSKIVTGIDSISYFNPITHLMELKVVTRLGKHSEKRFIYGNKLETEQIEIIKSLQKNDIIFIEDITAIAGLDDRRRRLSPIKIIIKK